MEQEGASMSSSWAIAAEEEPSDAIDDGFSPNRIKDASPRPITSSIATTKPYTLSSTVSRRHCIIISCVILLSHGLFLWGQLDILWAQYVSYSVTGDVSVAVGNVSDTATSVIGNATNNTFIAGTIDNIINGNTSIGERLDNITFEKEVNSGDAYLVGKWSYGAMLNELWMRSKVTAVMLFVFSAFWPHLKLLLLHIYFYRPVPSKPRRAALYWLDAVGKMSLADVCATCMIFLLLNIQASINTQDLESIGILKNIGPFIVDNIPNGTVSNETQKIIDEITASVYYEVANLSQSIFTNGDSKIYTALLEEGCAKFRNGGVSCSGTPLYEPTPIKTKAQIATKCLPILNKCRQCECIVNEFIYNQLIPGEVVEAKIGDAVSLTFAKLLAFVKTEAGNIDFASLFSVEGDLEMKSQVFAYPAFLGFTVAVFVSIFASLLVDEVETKDAMKRLNGGATTLSEALENSGIDEDKRSLLFGFNEEGTYRKWMSRIPVIMAGLLIVPIVFLAIYVKMFVWTTEGLVEELLMMQVSPVSVYYSIIDCVQKVNNGTAYGWVFAILYGILMLATPILRAALLLVITVVPMSPLWHVRVAKMSNHVGSFIAWEPFFICVVIMAFELPQLTGESVPPQVCQNLEDRYGISEMVARFGLDSNTCFIMYFYIIGEFALYVMAWLCLTTFNAMAWKIVLKKYNPFGTCKEEGELVHLGGPYCDVRDCCFFCECCKRDQEAVRGPTHWQRMRASFKCRKDRYASASEQEE